MKVSIVTTAYNSAKTIEDTIKSVLSQTYPNIEYIIVDGGSTDGTQEVIMSYKSKVSRFVSERDKGIYDGMNKGYALATGDVVGQINSDDFYGSSDVIQKVVDAFQKSKADVCYGDLEYVDEKNTDHVFRRWKAEEYDSKKFKRGWMPPHPTFFARRETYQKYGTFRLDMGTSADYELMLRLLLKHKLSACYIPEILVKMRVGGASNKNLWRRLKANRNDYRAWKVNGLKVSPLILLWKPLSKLHQFFK